VTPTRRLRLAALLASALALAGCERVMRDMYEQPKQLPATASPLFADGLASRPPPPGSVAHAQGDLAATSSGREGEAAVHDEAVARTAGVPTRPSRALLARGQERYDIFCLPCHSAVGDGEGPVVRRGFPAPPSYHQPRLVAAPDRHFYDVISHGYGVMFSYADRIAPADRWAIVAYIRALQLSQAAPVADLPPALRDTLVVASGEAAKGSPETAAERSPVDAIGAPKEAPR
jgi:mono/diheme cytochrome c family protein